MHNLKTKCFFLLFTVISLLGYAQNTPFFKNFNLSKYNATNQNWDVAEPGKFQVFVGPNSNTENIEEFELSEN